MLLLLWLLYQQLFHPYFGLLFGVILVITDEKGIRPNKVINKILGKITDIIRSFPTMILIVAIAPLTRFFIGTIVGTLPAIFAISIGCIPYATRMTESALNTVDSQLIKAAKVLGATDFQIVYKVMLTEALPNLIQNFTIMIINLLNMTTIAGAIGAGGLGAVALTYGYQRFDYVIMYFVVFILIVIVLVIQSIGKILYNKVK